MTDPAARAHAARDVTALPIPRPDVTPSRSPGAPRSRRADPGELQDLGELRGAGDRFRRRPQAESALTLRCQSRGPCLAPRFRLWSPYPHLENPAVMWKWRLTGAPDFT